MRNESFNVPQTVDFTGCDEERPRCILNDERLCFGVDSCPLLRISFGTTELQEFVYPRIGVERTVTSIAELAAVEQGPEAVVWVSVTVTQPKMNMSCLPAAVSSR